MRNKNKTTTVAKTSIANTPWYSGATRKETKVLNAISSSMLFSILSAKRPAWSATEESIIHKHITPLNPSKDTFGNLIVNVPKTKGGRSETLFCCHTDTVHRTDGQQKIYLDTALNEVFVDKNSNCLGADDGTGMYIMINMIKNKVPGTYIFHRAEEIGCQGSKFIVKNNAPLLRLFRRAISFDRKGMDEVIIAQAPGIIASTEFGEALCEELNVCKKLKYRTSKLGSITDSGQYYEQIPECVNLSVGYNNQHTSRETQNIEFLKELLPRLIRIDWDALPTKRIAGPAAEKFPQSNYNNRYNTQNTQNTQSTQSNLQNKIPEKKLIMLVMQQPRVAVALLKELGPSSADLWNAEFDMDEENNLYQSWFDQ